MVGLRLDNSEYKSQDTTLNQREWDDKVETTKTDGLQLSHHHHHHRHRPLCYIMILHLGKQ